MNNAIKTVLFAMLITAIAFANSCEKKADQAAQAAQTAQEEAQIAELNKRLEAAQAALASADNASPEQVQVLQKAVAEIAEQRETAVRTQEERRRGSGQRSGQRSGRDAAGRIGVNAQAAQTAQRQTPTAELNGMGETPQAAEGQTWRVGRLNYRVLPQVVEPLLSAEPGPNIWNIDDRTIGRWYRYPDAEKYQIVIANGYFYSGGHDSFPIFYPDAADKDLRSVDLIVGAFVYMRHITHKFRSGSGKYKDILVNADSEKNMADRHDAILQAIVSQGRIKLNEIAPYYQNNIKDLVAEVVEGALGDRYLGGPDGEFEESTVSQSDRNTLAREIADFLVNPNDNLVDTLISRQGKYYAGKTSIPFGSFIEILNYFDIAPPGAKFDEAKFLRGDLSDFAGAWVNDGVEGFDLGADGSIIGYYKNPGNFRREGRGTFTYVWSFDDVNGFSVEAALYPVGHDILGYDRPSDTTKVRLAIIMGSSIYYGMVYYRSADGASPLQ